MDDSLSEAVPRPRATSRKGVPSDTMPPPLVPTSSATATTTADAADLDGPNTRLARSASVVSRSNRLSLTLPIALPSAFPSRPMPMSATVASFPPTPSDVQSVLSSPVDPDEIITAIAAEERRVLGLREDLQRAEAGLAKLKRQWQSYEVQRKMAEIRRTEALRAMATRHPGTEMGPVSARTVDAAASDSGDSVDAKRAGETDRRRALLHQQQNPQQAGSSGPSTPTKSKRRVFTGRHTRALSLLSPTKSTLSDGFPVHEDQADGELAMSPSSVHESDAPYKTSMQPSKRASWAPQSVHQTTGFKLAGDLTATLWNFVEDIRQATVGDEAVHGETAAATPAGSSARRALASDDDLQNTIRPSHGAARPAITQAFDTQATPTRPATAGSRAQLSRSGSKSTKKTDKRFSYTPLTVDSYDDSDWASWDSPTVKSPRWSGSTMSGEAVIAEQADENSTLPTSPTSPDKGDWSAALSKLTPTNLRRTATDLIKEWEKNLSVPLEGTAGAEAVAHAHM